MERKNENRLRILDWLRLRDKLTISELAGLLKVSRPTIYLHLDILEKKGLIKRTQKKEKKGAPVTITLIEKEISKEETKRILKYLNLLKQNGGDLELDNFTMMRESANSLFRGYTKSITVITPAGEAFLKQNQGAKK